MPRGAEGTSMMAAGRSAKFRAGNGKDHIGGWNDLLSQ